MRRVYLDHNATTPLRAEVKELLLQRLEEVGGNPSSPHASGRHARQLVDEARARVAEALGAREEEILFTSGGTESNNLALQGTVRAAGAGKGLVTTTAEHSSVLETALALEEEGRPLWRVPVGAQGQPDVERLLEAAARPECALVSCMAANNEVGSVADLAALGRGLRELPDGGPRLHVDAVQALGRLPLELAAWDADLASFSAHKVGGPVGVGVLWKRAGVPLHPLLHGGGQEAGLRPGTENAAGIAATALAIELAVDEQQANARHTAELAREVWSELETSLPSIRLFGPAIDAPARLPNTLCVLVPESDGKVLVTRLDLEGLEVSAGSACASGSIEPSHVLLAMGLGPSDARSALRLSLGSSTTRAECRLAVEILLKVFAPSHAR